MFGKRQIREMALLMLLVLCFALPAIGQAEPSWAKGVDLIVLLDHGYSLTKSNPPTDPGQYRFDAGAALLSMLPEENVRAGYVPFNDQPLTYNRVRNRLEYIPKNNGLGLYDVSLSLGRSRRLQMLEELIAPRMIHSQEAAKSTDIGLALEAAVEALLREDNGHRKVIVLFADSAPYFTNAKENNKPNPAKMAENSAKRAREARDRAQQNGITIHTVLLKDTTGTAFMQNDARTDDGLFFFVTDSEDLPAYFARIGAHEAGTDLQAASGTTKGSGTISIRLDNGQAESLNIVLPIVHLDVKTLALVAPDGSRLQEKPGRFLSDGGQNVRDHQGGEACTGRMAHRI